VDGDRKKSLREGKKKWKESGSFHPLSSVHRAGKHIVEDRRGGKKIDLLVRTKVVEGNGKPGDDGATRGLQTV